MKEKKEGNPVSLADPYLLVSTDCEGNLVHYSFCCAEDAMVQAVQEVEAGNAILVFHSTAGFRNVV